jgi:hypothetical protein
VWLDIGHDGILKLGQMYPGPSIDRVGGGQRRSVGGGTLYSTEDLIRTISAATETEDI